MSSSDMLDDGEGNGSAEVRYSLTALGETLLDEQRMFSGFGPCAASCAAAHAAPGGPAQAARLSRRADRARVVPLFP